MARGLALASLVSVVLVVGCSPPDGRATPGSGKPAAGTEAPAVAGPPDEGTGPDLAALRIDDDPPPAPPYDREDWGDWADLDGDGCDTRDEVLMAQSLTPAQVDPYRCQVVAGDWRSAYDGVETEAPGDLDIDHVVPLADAHASGGWQWTAERRRAFANDETNLLAVTATTNRSKGSRTPDEWRPPDEDAWCELATIWVEVKVRYDLTATTAERDALGAMLDTCP